MYTVEVFKKLYNSVEKEYNSFKDSLINSSDTKLVYSLANKIIYFERFKTNMEAYCGLLKVNDTNDLLCIGDCELTSDVLNTILNKYDGNLIDYSFNNIRIEAFEEPVYDCFKMLISD